MTGAATAVSCATGAGEFGVGEAGPVDADTSPTTVRPFPVSFTGLGALVGVVVGAGFVVDVVIGTGFVVDVVIGAGFVVGVDVGAGFVVDVVVRAGFVVGVDLVGGVDGAAVVGADECVVAGGAALGCAAAAPVHVSSARATGARLAKAFAVRRGSMFLLPLLHS